MLGWILRLASRLPLRVLHALGAAFGRLAMALSPSYRRKTADNLRTAGLHGDAMMAQAAREAGRAVFETPLVWFSPPRRLAALFDCRNEQLVRAALAGGRGAILLTPHLGCFEVAARAVAAIAPITVLYKPPKLAAVRAVVESAREAPGLRAVPANAAGVRALLRALRRGECVGILPDQVPGEGDGVWAPFFGRPAYTMTLPQRLAQLTGAPVIVGVGERLAKGRGWTVHFEALGGDASPESVNAAMESLVRRFPSQYFWGYNRYKTPARAGRAAPRAGGADGRGS
jgi:KDO2-lipid IV(A) lauroyltransferase